MNFPLYKLNSWNFMQTTTGIYMYIRLWMLSVKFFLFKIWANNKICTTTSICALSSNIRYGFPPHELQPPEEGHENDPVPLQHGDRVMVEHLKPTVLEEQPPDVVMSELKAPGSEGSASTSASGTNQQEQGTFWINWIQYMCSWSFL